MGPEGILSGRILWEYGQRINSSFLRLLLYNAVTMPARFLHRHKRLTFTLVVIVCLTLFLNYGPWSARGTFARIVTEEVTQRVDITYDSGNTMHYLGLHADPPMGP